MKITINTLVTPGKKIGVGIYIDNILKYFHRNKGQNTYEIIVSKNNPDLFDINQTTFKKIVLPIASHPSWLQILWQPVIMLNLYRNQPDLLHVPNTSPLIFKVCPTVISILDLQEFYTNKYGKIRGLYRKIINYVAARIADHIITISKHSRKDIVQHLKVPKNKVSVTYLSVDSSFRPIDRDKCYGHVNNRYKLMGAPYILSVGELHPGKNFVRLIQAFSLIKPNHRAVKLVIVGKKGWDYDDIFQNVIQLGLEDDIIFTGYVSGEELPLLYNSSTITVFPTLYEGFGLPALEAMACGSPLIASDTSSLPEVVGEAGILINPYDVGMMAEKIDMLLSDPILRYDLVAKGFEQAAKFNWEKTARETLSVYANVCQRYGN